MDLNSKQNFPVLTDSVPIKNSRLSIHSSLLSCSPPAPLSPPPVLTFMGKSIRLSNADTDVAYHSWLLKYPSALGSFEQITSYADGKKIALFLDYDGTLSPIVDNPESAFMSVDMRAAVRNAAKYFPTAIISGRSRDKVYELVGLTELYYAGSHGMDILGPDTQAVMRRNLFQPATGFLPVVDKVFRTLVETVGKIKGAVVENNKFCVSVHYRNVDKANWSRVGQEVQDVLKGFPDLRLTYGLMVLEIRPAIDWNKGKAMEFLLESLGLGNGDDVFPIYVGDDQTDEDAFAVLRVRRRVGGILVSSVPKESSAVYSLRDPSEVMKFLELLVTWKKKIAA